MKLCIELTAKPIDTPVKLEQKANGKFKVTYGNHVRYDLSYGSAARELGECIMHSLACSGTLDAGTVLDDHNSPAQGT